MMMYTVMSKDYSTEPLPALGLKLKDQPLNFFTPAEFEFALAGRTAVPSAKLQRLVRCTMRELRAEARSIMEAEKQLIEILWRSIEDPASITPALREMDLLIFSQDHEWREIIHSLNALDEDYHAYRRIAAIKYVQYLASRQDIVRHLYHEKKNQAGDSDAEPDNSLRDALMLHAPLTAGNNPDHKYERMPKGETVRIHLPASSKMELLLARHHCHLVNEDGFEFCDDRGTKHRLEQKRSSIGRDVQCSIMVDPSWRDVSRMHLIIEVRGRHDLEITDMSSHGTFIPAHYLLQQSA